MDSDRIRWQERYAEKELLHGESPSRFLAAWLQTILRLAPGIRTLDIACGEGRNSLFLARNGFRVTGVDIAERALARAGDRCNSAGLTAEFLMVDLDLWRPVETYDLIVNINFLQRELLPVLAANLSPGGLLFVDTIMAGDFLSGRHNPAYLLSPGELTLLFATLPGEIILSEEAPEAAAPHAALLFQKSRTTSMEAR